jgi:hypothetical protein
VTFAGGLMWDGVAIDILPGDIVEFLVLGYSSTGALRVVSRRANGEISPKGCSPDAGNAPATLTIGSSYETLVFNTILTADRAVTLTAPPANIGAGARFRIVRTAAATGVFNVNVGTGPLKALIVGSWCDVEYNLQTAAWMLTAYGLL